MSSAERFRQLLECSGVRFTPAETAELAEAYPKLERLLDRLRQPLPDADKAPLPATRLERRQ